MKRVDGSDGSACQHRWVWAGWRYPNGRMSVIVVLPKAKSILRCLDCGVERDR